MAQGGAAAASAGPTFGQAIGQALQARAVRAVAGSPAAPRQSTTALGFTTRQTYLQGVQRVVGPQEAVQTMGGVVSGAAITALLIYKLFPKNQVPTAALVGVGGAILAASSPVGSLPEDLGMGATIFAAGWGLLRAFGQIKAPVSTSGAPVMVTPLRSGGTIVLTRR